MERSGLFVLIVIVLLAIGGYFYFSAQNGGAPAGAPEAAAGDTSAPQADLPYGIPAGEATATGTAQPVNQ